MVHHHIDRGENNTKNMPSALRSIMRKKQNTPSANCSLEKRLHSFRCITKMLNMKLGKSFHKKYFKGEEKNIYMNLQLHAPWGSFFGVQPSRIPKTKKQIVPRPSLAVHLVFSSLSKLCSPHYYVSFRSTRWFHHTQDPYPLLKMTLLTCSQSWSLPALRRASTDDALRATETWLTTWARPASPVINGRESFKVFTCRRFLLYLSRMTSLRM